MKMSEEELRYQSWSDEDMMKEIEKRLKEMKQLLIEVRDLLKASDELE
jgi:phosphomevalonate kinase